MNLEEKKENCGNFIKSAHFTEATYGVIIVVRENIYRMVNLIELYKIVLNRIESGDIKHNFPDEELVKIKQLILVDALSKIMILIESLLVLYDSFSRFPYKEVPLNMIKYTQQKIDSFIKRFSAGKVHVWKICGFPRLASLRHNCGLTKEDTKFIHDILENSCDSVTNAIEDIVNFYQSNRILYGKFKHGLLFMPGLTFGSLADQKVPSSIFLAFDKLKKRPAKLCFQGREISPPGLEWFNTYTILPYWEHTFERYVEILVEIKRLSTYILNNHLLWAFNCGQDYLPMKILPNGETLVEIYLTKQLTNEEQKKFQELSQKVVNNVYCPKPKLNIIFNFSEEKCKKLLDCFMENQSATIWKSSAAD